MTRLKVTAKGQVTLRADLLRHMGVAPGERIVVDKLPGGRIAVAAERPSASIAEAFGMLERKGGPVLSIEEIGAIAAEGWAGKR
jgi:bifunctional DNA-binding transcriptional regulator/antitoxin component of YhaV-PrlF toxin-antitoxin module